MMNCQELAQLAHGWLETLTVYRSSQMFDRRPVEVSCGLLPLMTSQRSFKWNQNQLDWPSLCMKQGI